MLTVEVRILRDGKVIEQMNGPLNCAMAHDYRGPFDYIEDADPMYGRILVGWEFTPKLQERPWTRRDYEEELAEGRLEEQAIEDAERNDHERTEP